MKRGREEVSRLKLVIRRVPRRTTLIQRPSPRHGLTRGFTGWVATIYHCGTGVKADISALSRDLLPITPYPTEPDDILIMAKFPIEPIYLLQHTT